jgi:hypothetical protein
VRGTEGPAYAIPMHAISSLERSRGRSTSAGAITGMRRGTLIGLGLALANLGFSDRACNDEAGECTSAAAGIAAWTGLGSGLGLVIGSVTGSERWERVPLQLALSPHRGGTLAVSLGWAPRGRAAP